MFRPNKLLLSLSLSLVLLLAYPSLFAQEESITMTTYYPSPYGSYREMRAKRMAIGDDYIDGVTYSWDSLPPSINADADLVVQGNVGIGTTSPGGKLAVNDSTFYQASAWNESSPLHITSTYAGIGSNIATFENTNVAGGSFLQIFTAAVNVSGIQAGTSQAAGAQNLSLQPNGGNVGIGTTAPGAPLDIGAGTAGFPVTSGTTQTYGSMRIVPSSATSNGVGDFGDSGGALGNAFWIQSTNRTNLSLGYPLLLNPNGGNVGIGTTSPQAALHVNGGVIVGNYATKPTCNANTKGMLVFDTTNDRPYVCANSSTWKPLDSTAWTAAGTSACSTKCAGIGLTPVSYGAYAVCGAVPTEGITTSGYESGNCKTNQCGVNPGCDSYQCLCQ